MSGPTAPAVAHVERVWAEDNAACASSLRSIDASWGTETFPLAGGRAVLCGAGLYVNVALACGVSVDLDAADLLLLEARSAAVGVSAAIELTPASTASTRQAVEARGYRRVGETSAVWREVADVASDGDDFSVRVVDAPDDLMAWQRAAAAGWGHVTDDRRRASDAFAAAVFATDGQTLFLASDRDGGVVGCASVQVRGDLATFGGMSTLPEHRRRGVQAALVSHRMRFARAADVRWAVSTTAPGGASERNLLRLGFVRSHVKETFESS